MTQAVPPIRVIAVYRFTSFEDLASIRDTLDAACRSKDVKGTLLLAREGINGTIAGSDAAIAAVLRHIRALPGCADVGVKEARAAAMPFHRLKVRIKREIVTMGRPDIDPVGEAGRYVAPEDWNALVDDPDVILIDTRNDYEVAIGSFHGAVDPRTKSFRDFPEWFERHRGELQAGENPPRIAMFCTGGIRCEKATAYLKRQGLDEVYHLEGGILSYLERISPEASRWEGECFVFDERVSVGHGLEQGSHELCRACRMPVGEAERKSKLYMAGISCPACHDQRSDEQRRGYAERHRQSTLAEARGVAHVGARQPGSNDD
ncbi:rhodanese-related sulfurtransferase [Novosphingopyxis sp.]|uniref:oxygen-dependent tRNA uridine(34) hydroxylase TrhO n=1 Tax=Novosphingopyxis sp. TaxID=2709690 RepID=UPI003B595010